VFYPFTDSREMNVPRTFTKPVHSTSKPSPPKTSLAAKKRFTGWSDENKELTPMKNTTALGHR